MSGSAYAMGAGFVVHRSGARLDREDCERVRRYLAEQIANPSWSRESTDARKRDLAELDAAMAASFPEPEQRTAAE